MKFGLYSLLLCGITGLAASLTLFALIFIDSNGSIPGGICDKFILADTGWPLFNKSGNPDIFFRCEIDFALASFYILIPAVVIAFGLFIIILIWKYIYFYIKKYQRRIQ